MNLKFRLLLWLAAAGLTGIFLVGAMVVAFQLVIRGDPENLFTPENILKILGRESVVYYADGKTTVGTFFDDKHRDYIPFDSIPKTLVDAVIAAEDRNYWSHGGMDFKAVVVAMRDNVESGRLKRGGSTLTQQTSKILFGRKGRTLLGKVGELVNAYRLEQNFTKQQILEFYLNQFFVSGNGHGVRIAARYFFDKEPGDLSLAECAFIAGSVKGPNQYNPFLWETSEKKEAALQRGRYRVAYVLEQMRRQEKISEREYRRALEEKLQFRRGAFRFVLSTNVVRVKQLLESPEMQRVLANHEVDDYTTAGLHIYTTLDPDLQRASEYALYSNLWRLDLLLKGYRIPADTAIDLPSHFIPGAFLLGTVDTVEFQEGFPQSVRVRFGTLEGKIPREALETFFRLWNRHETGRDALPSKPAMVGFATRYLRKGQWVYCGVPYRTPEEQAADTNADGNLGGQLELAQKPLLQGAAQVVQAGRVLANVGGFGNTGYDRVNQARRQFGSAFKPLVYAAALELGWKPLDPLLNSRQLFRVGNIFYYPKPDHKPEDTVSMAWAGRRSENIASVYLLFHLFDKTDFSRFWEACRSMHLAPDNFASQRDFEIYVRDSLGYSLNDERFRELRYQKAVNDLAIDLVFEGRIEEAERLRTLPYGAGFARERKKHRGSRNPEIRKENQIQVRLLGRSYLDLTVRATRISDSTSASEISRGTLNRLAGMLSIRETENSETRYSPENLFASQDFRALAAMRYIVEFSRKLGITTPLDPVLSYPLGVNAITLEEAMSAYQVFQDGGVYRTRFGQSQLYIAKITSADGKLIFEDHASREPVLSNPARFALEAILAAVVKSGTGQRIGRELRMRFGSDTAGWVVPAYGKTGTTNDYRNGAFLGFVPAPREPDGGFDPALGYTMGAYVGFDDNSQMIRKGFKGTGGAVALPVWLNMAQALVKLKNFSAQVDTLDLNALATGEAALFEQEKYRRYDVTRRTGLPLSGDSNSVPAYADDLSDELDASDASEETSGMTSIWVREE